MIEAERGEVAEGIEHIDACRYWCRARQCQDLIQPSGALDEVITH
jgi:hypothetical protein